MSDKITIKLLSGKNLSVVVDSLKDVSDGYHTIEELYDHRCLLFIALCLKDRETSFYKEDPTSPGWFILYLETKYGQINYHLPDKFLPIVASKIKRNPEYVWDGHTSKDVLERIEKLIAG